MKLLFSIVALAINFCAYSQDDKTVTLIVSGQGQTQDEAKQNALRNAIEQAFGTFISSKTEILNDELVKDEIVSVANGNIQDFEILSEVQTPDGGYATTLKATVSVTKLTSFSKGKGIEVEFNGSLFAFNVMQQKLNEENELIAIRNACEVAYKISKSSFDYKIEASDPKNEDANGVFEIPLTIHVSKNNNFSNIPKILHSTLQGLSLTKDEVDSYKKLGETVYAVSFADENGNAGYYALRREESILEIVKLLWAFRNSIMNFKISNGISEFTVQDNPHIVNLISDFGCRHFLMTPRATYDPSIFSILEDFYSLRSRKENVIEKFKIRLESYPLSRMDVITLKLDFNPNKIGNENVFPDGLKSKDYYDYRYHINHYQTSLFIYGKTFSSSPRFNYVIKLKESLIDDNLGLIISFMPYYTGYSKERMKALKNEVDLNEIILIELNDYRSLEEIMNISGYKVIPKNN